VWEREKRERRILGCVRRWMRELSFEEILSYLKQTFPLG